MYEYEFESNHGINSLNIEMIVHKDFNKLRVYSLKIAHKLHSF